MHDALRDTPDLSLGFFVLFFFLASLASLGNDPDLFVPVNVDEKGTLVGVGLLAWRGT
jgi:hypothetical protein